MSKSDNYLEQEGMSGGQTLLSKLWNKPQVTIGILSCAAIVGFGIYGFKKRKTSTSLYIVQFRVYAQTAALGCMAGGLLYHLYSIYTKPIKKD